MGLESLHPMRARDSRLDAARGFALATIAITHMPGTVYEDYTLRAIGFSDAAEAFVLMSGVAAGLAYGKFWAEDGNPTLGRAKAWNRAWILLLCHWALTLTAVLLALVGVLLGWPDLAQKHGLQPVTQGSWAHTLGLFALTHQIGYVNILTMYAPFMAALPLLLRGIHRHPTTTLLISALVWLGAGHWDIGPMNWPGAGRWQFNPLAWQFLFTIGLWCGVRSRSQTLPLPKGRLPVGLALLFLALVAAIRLIPDVGAAWIAVGQDLASLGVPEQIRGYYKPDLALPRLVHALLLGYVIWAIPAFQPLAAHPLMAPLRLMGRHGLVVFCAATILSLLGQMIISATPDTLWRDTLLCIGVLAGLIAVALVQDMRIRRHAVCPHPTALQS